MHKRNESKHRRYNPIYEDDHEEKKPAARAKSHSASRHREPPQTRARDEERHEPNPKRYSHQEGREPVAHGTHHKSHFVSEPRDHSPSRPRDIAGAAHKPKQTAQPYIRELEAQGTREINLKSFNFSKMPLGFSWYIFGGSGKGKTILLENIMYHNRDRFHSGFIQTPTKDVIDKFGKHMPLCYINPVHSVEQIDQVDDTKKLIISRLPNGEKDDKKPMFVILDDVAYNREFCQDYIFNKITFNGRHYNFTMFLASYKYKALENNARSNVHFFCTYWDSAVNVRKAIWAEQFSSCFESYDEFEAVYKTVCCPPKRQGEQYARPRCLIVDKRYSSSDPNECCFYFEPSFEVDDFQIGSRDFRVIGWFSSKQFNRQASDVKAEMSRRLSAIYRAMHSGSSRDYSGAQAKEIVKRPKTTRRGKSVSEKGDIKLLRDPSQ